MAKMSYTQKRLNKAWKMKGCKLEELAQAVGCKGRPAYHRTALFYQRMVEQGVRVAHDQHSAPWPEITRRLAAGESVERVAISYGIMPGNLREWMQSREKREQEMDISTVALRLPFARWGELFQQSA